MPSPLPFDPLASIRADIARCSHLARTVPHDAPLPHLPGWDVAAALAHLAGDFVWATGIVTARGWDGRTFLAPVPERGQELVDAFDRHAAAMVAALEVAAAHPDEPCPNFAERRSGRLAWWPRHQAHETAMHRWDLEVPTGRHAPFDPAQAADGVDEALHVYTRRYPGQDLATEIVVACTDVGASWRITPVDDDGRVEVARAPGRAPDADGTAAGLLLAVWQRLDPDTAGIRFHRHEQAARAFLAGPLTA